MAPITERYLQEGSRFVTGCPWQYLMTMHSYGYFMKLD